MGILARDVLINMVCGIMRFNSSSPLICKGNQWTGFYITENSVVKEFISNTIK